MEDWVFRWGQDVAVVSRVPTQVGTLVPLYPALPYKPCKPCKALPALPAHPSSSCTACPQLCPTSLSMTSCSGCPAIKLQMLAVDLGHSSLPQTFPGKLRCCLNLSLNPQPSTPTQPSLALLTSYNLLPPTCVFCKQPVAFPNLPAQKWPTTCFRAPWLAHSVCRLISMPMKQTILKT